MSRSGPSSSESDSWEYDFGVRFIIAQCFILLGNAAKVVVFEVNPRILFYLLVFSATSAYKITFDSPVRTPKSKTMLDLYTKSRRRNTKLSESGLLSFTSSSKHPNWFLGLNTKRLRSSQNSSTYSSSTPNTMQDA